MLLWTLIEKPPVRPLFGGKPIRRSNSTFTVPTEAGCTPTQKNAPAWGVYIVTASAIGKGF